MLAAMHGQSSGGISLALSAIASHLGTCGARLLQACAIASLLAHGAAAQEKRNAVERTANRAAASTERGVKKPVKAVERAAKKTDRALNHAAKKTDNWVHDKTR